ncbi:MULTISPECIES: LysR family transcriptional regulator [Hyphomicrobiales]|uniref:LysR family transcriptional regulator n=1 Tax=Methylobacterium sp. CCH7-A2 TaxID=1768789 RepID=UPI001FDAA0A5|nr:MULTISPECIES: LysR family transcriptional regulator [Hyphomicrobiales]
MRWILLRFGTLHSCPSNTNYVDIDASAVSGIILSMIHPSLQTKIRYFLAVADAMSFRKAAARLGIAQPALSRSVRQLEDHLGFVLLERSTRHMALTPAGQVLFREAADAMNRLDRACARAAQAAQGLSGTVMVGYSTFAANGPMSDIIIAFRRRYPSARVGLRLLASPEQATAIEDGTLDLGFMMSNVPTNSALRMPISRERLIALVPSDHAFATSKSIPLRRLTSVPIVIGTEVRWRGFRLLVDNMMRSAGLSLTIVEEADDLPVLLQFVRSGFGCSILDASFVATLPPGIRALEIEDTTETLDIVLACQQSHASPLVSHFLTEARSHVQLLAAGVQIAAD